jgi:hypothetical protein
VSSRRNGARRDAAGRGSGWHTGELYRAEARPRANAGDNSFAPQRFSLCTTDGFNFPALDFSRRSGTVTPELPLRYDPDIGRTPQGLTGRVWLSPQKRLRSAGPFCRR